MASEVWTAQHLVEAMMQGDFDSIAGCTHVLLTGVEDSVASDFTRRLAEDAAFKQRVDDWDSRRTMLRNNAQDETPLQ